MQPRALTERVLLLRNFRAARRAILAAEKEADLAHLPAYWRRVVGAVELVLAGLDPAEALAELDEGEGG